MHYPDRGELYAFQDACMLTQDFDFDNVPYVEAPRSIIEHYNRGKMEGFDKAGYFMYQSVRVYEKGKRTEQKPQVVTP